MPFRTNFFGESIALPGTESFEIEHYLIDRYNFDTVEIASADLFLESDETFGFGGTLHYSVSIEDEDGGAPNHEDASMEFDGFASSDAAKDWLQNSYPGIMIMEVN